MADTPKGNGNNLFSQYLGRWISLAIFMTLIILAAAALFLEPDYPARVPLRIGVCAFDSVTSAPTLESFAATVRERDGGDISWVWLEEGKCPGSCDFYLMTSLQFLSVECERAPRCLLLASPRDDGQLSKGVVISGKGRKPDWSKTVFTSAISATGFLSPMSALEDNGVPATDVVFETLSTGCPVCAEAVAFGVMLGSYGAGGLPLDQLRRMEESGVIPPGSIEVLYTGPALPEIILAADAGTEEWKSGGFAGRLPGISSNLPDPLRREMKRLGMSVFRAPSEDELDFEGKVPGGVWESAGYHFP